MLGSIRPDAIWKARTFRPVRLLVDAVSKVLMRCGEFSVGVLASTPLNIEAVFAPRTFPLQIGVSEAPTPIERRGDARSGLSKGRDRGYRGLLGEGANLVRLCARHAKFLNVGAPTRGVKALCLRTTPGCPRMRNQRFACPFWFDRAKTVEVGVESGQRTSRIGHPVKIGA